MAASKDNQYAKKWTSARALQQAVNAFFRDCDIRGQHYTLSGLARSLGVHRNTLINYAGDEDLCTIIRDAKAMCEEYAEKHLFEKGISPQGIMFSLKNNYGWEQRTKQEITGKDGRPVEAVISGQVHVYLPEKKPT